MFETTERPAAINRYVPKKTADNRVTQDITGKFIGALVELESARDVELIVALFADDCEIGNIAATKKFRGIAGARRFWTGYRAAFKDVCSIFQNEIYSGNEAKLQWTTEGKSANGRKIKYEGVSLLEMSGEKITHFYAYFDRNSLKRQIVGQAKSAR